MAFDTFDTDSVATAGVTFSNGNLTALGASGTSIGSSATAQALEGKKTGKWYVEFTCVAVSGNVDGVGVVCSAGIANSFIGGDSPGCSWGYYTNSHVAKANVTQTSVNSTTWGAGDVIGVAIDLDNKRVWWRKNTGSWVGTSGTPDPATNTSGFDISVLLANGLRVYPVANMSGAAAKFTANFGATSFTGTTPSGFTAGWTNTSSGTYFGSFATTGHNSASVSAPPASDKAVTKYVASLTGSVTSIVFAFTVGINVQAVVYADSSGAPGALLATSSNSFSGFAAPCEFAATFSGLNVTSGTTYWIGLNITGSVVGDAINCPPLTSGIAFNSSVANTPSNPFGASPSTANFRYPLLVFVTTSSTETGTGGMAFGGVAFSGAGRRQESAAGAMAFPGIAFSARAVDFTATGRMGLSGIAFAGAATRDEAGAGLMSLAGVAFAGAADDDTGAGRMSLAGLGFSGSAMRMETAIGAMHLAGVRIGGVLAREETAIGAMHLAGISIRGLGVRPTPAGGGLRQLWTF